ncbi:MAG: ATP-binding protein [Bacteroidia bacterium]
MNDNIKSHLDRIHVVNERIYRNTSLDFVRYLKDFIDWGDRLIGVTGGRGVGKTTMILQHMISTFPEGKPALYVSLDEYLFEEIKLLDLVEVLFTEGYTNFYFDEVHRYPRWSKDLKLIYDSNPEVNVVFSGSSILDIYKGESDLSRRAVLYNLPELSFREYLAFEHKQGFKAYALEEILDAHKEISLEISDGIDVLKEFKKYEKQGAYPFYKGVKRKYHAQLLSIINMVIENDLPNTVKMDYKSVHKLRRLMHFISGSGPFTPNITKLSSQIEASRNVLLEFIDYLDRAQIIHALKSPNKSDSHLTKPDKIFLHNPNIMHALSYGEISKGASREAFFASQISAAHSINIPKITDFVVDNTYFFEIGGPNKGFNQVAGVPNSYVVIDEVKYSSGNRIPLWLFGFLY